MPECLSFPQSLLFEVASVRVQRDLGMKLEAGKADLEVLTIDKGNKGPHRELALARSDILNPFAVAAAREAGSSRADEPGDYTMKRMLPLALTVLAVSAGAFAQSPDIDRPLTAAPRNLKDGATVIKWKADFTYDTLKKGTNKLVCYDRTGQPGQTQAFSVECTSLANLDRVAQNLKFEAIPDKKASQAAFDAAEKDGTRVKPEFGSVWIHMTGPDADHLRSHVTIAVPMATMKTMGLPETGAQGGVWIMNAGTTTAHLMTPGQ